MCQILANLCVLTLYDQNSGVCSFFNDRLKEFKEAKTTSYGDKNWIKGYPWITYATNPFQLIKRPISDSGFKFTASFYTDAS